MAFNKDQFIEDIKAMSVLELNEVVKAIEEEFGVSAAAPVAVAGGAGEAAGAAEDGKKTVKLVNAGGAKMKVIQELRKITPELSLQEAKALADNGGDVKADVSADEAADIVAKLEELGAEVEAA